MRDFYSLATGVHYGSKEQWEENNKELELTEEKRN